MSQDTNKTDVLVAFVVGGLVGAALGVLFAPKSGKETRESLNKWMGDAVEKSKTALGKMGEELKQRKDQLAQTFSGDKQA